MLTKKGTGTLLRPSPLPFLPSSNPTSPTPILPFFPSSLRFPTVRFPTPLIQLGSLGSAVGFPAGPAGTKPITDFWCPLRIKSGLLLWFAEKLQIL